MDYIGRLRELADSVPAHMRHNHTFGEDCRRTCPVHEKPEFKIRKLPLLRSAPWTILSPRRLQMVGCLAYWCDMNGMWAYPFKTQQFALFALEHALKREAV